MSQQLELLTENPSQWTSVSLLSPEIQKKEIKPYVVLALKELEGNPDSRTSSLMNVDKFSAVRAVVRHLARLRSANKEPWASEDVTVFLESLRFSPECVEELTSLLCLDKVYENVPKHLRVKPGLVDLQWKVDISLSQSNMSSENANASQAKEIMRRYTHIILILTLTDGQTLTYRLSINKFHELRYTVACALKNMIVLEKRKCMRKD
ncbi:COMM domain-containing protein 5 [Amyelois transitella]|uniref:COMM domain-containing protein 5 n=1 Tax=Amyelois transitella TaxID=680683 RepID=UPI00067D6EC4|nr:COMM domain-containing protein 5 [Amyelois transitella]